MLRRACSEEDAPPPAADFTGLALDDVEAAAAALAETDLVRCSTAALGSSRSESDMGASLLLEELRLLWCRILRLRLRWWSGVAI